MLEGLFGGNKKKRIVKCLEHEKYFTDLKAFAKHVEEYHTDEFEFIEEGD